MKQRLRIAQVGSRGIPGHRGGVDRVVEAIAPRLVDLGHDVIVYCATWSPSHEATYKGVELVYLYSPQRKYLDTFVRSFLATIREMFGPCDIVHFHSSPAASLAGLARLGRKKVVVTVHGREWQRRKWGFAGRWFLRFSEWSAVRVPHRTIVVGLRPPTGSGGSLRRQRRLHPERRRAAKLGGRRDRDPRARPRRA